MVSKTAFLFPGQGAQFVGMGQGLVGQLPAAAELFGRAEQVLGYDLAAICFQGPAAQLNSTIYSQPALFVCSLAALEKLRHDEPQLVASVGAAAGLSLGEYTALVLADVLDFEDALRVVQCRGEAMQAASDAEPSGMVSVLGLEEEQVKALCDAARQPGEILQIANYLCPGNLVCSGHRASCDELVRKAAEAGAMKAVPLAVAGAFHTPLMGSAVGRLERALQEVTLRRPRIPVLSNVDARPHDEPAEIRAALVRQVVSPVRWEPTMRRLLADAYTSFYEVGPGKVLRGLLKRIDRKVDCKNVQ
jgi:[acyl-carrier-protein] S-malonyltransferase